MSTWFLDSELSTCYWSNLFTANWSVCPIQGMCTSFKWSTQPLTIFLPLSVVAPYTLWSIFHPSNISCRTFAKKINIVVHTYLPSSQTSWQNCKTSVSLCTCACTLKYFSLYKGANHTFNSFGNMDQLRGLITLLSGLCIFLLRPISSQG